MKTAVFICVTGILSLLSSTSSFATDVKSDHDRAADCGRYKKYCWQKNLVWRGSATDTLSDKSDKNMKKLNKSVSKLFEHFPPQPKK